MIANVGKRLGSIVFQRLYYRASRSAKSINTAFIERSKKHLALLADRNILLEYLSDQKLLQLVEQHHFTTDIVQLAAFVESRALGSMRVSDCQAIFLAFTFNLYHDRIEAQNLLSLIIANLKQRFNGKKFDFPQRQIESHYLEQLYFLTFRSIPSDEQEKELRLLFYHFIEKKFKIDQISSAQITDEILIKLWQIYPYLPEESRPTIVFLDQFEKSLLDVLSFEFQRAKSLDSSEKEVMEEQIDRMCKLRELVIRLANCRQRFIKIFEKISYKVRSEADFTAFMFYLRQFLTEPLAKIVTKRDMNTFHQNLAQHCQTYQSPKTYRAMQSYCQRLIFLELYRPSDFVAYFNPQGASFLSLDNKYWNTKRWSHDKKI